MPSDQFFNDRRPSCHSSSSESSSTEPAETTDTTQSTSTPSTTCSPSSSPSPPPPSNSSTSNPSRKRKYHPNFEAILHFMASPLTPFINNETGQPHPEFPKNHLAFHLLTSSQLDNLARHYHQVYPARPATLSYPFQIQTWVGIPDESYVDIATKRRRFGYFVGMPGYTDPANSGLSPPVSCEGVLEDSIFFEPDWEGYEGGEEEKEEQEEVLEWMTREWEAALRKAGDSSDGPFRKY